MKTLDQQDSTEQQTNTKKLPLSVHFMAGWPLILVLFGGAIGGLFAGLAYVVNLKIYRSELTKMNKILANLMSGMVAIMLWWLVASWVQAYFGI